MLRVRWNATKPRIQCVLAHWNPGFTASGGSRQTCGGGIHAVWARSRQRAEGPAAPNWPTGFALGVGGIAGGYLGARIQSRPPDTLIRRTVGILAIAIAAQFLKSGLS